MTFDQLYQDIYGEESTKSPDAFIAIFEEHQELIESQIVQTDAGLYDKIMRLRADYAHSLTDRKQFTKAIPQLEKAINLFEENPGPAQKNLFTVPFYELLVFDRAIAHYHLKNISAAKQDLTNLRQHFPDNDIYKTWIQAVSVYSLKKWENVCFVIIGIGMLITTFWEREDIGSFYGIVLGIIALSLLCAVCIRVYIYLNKK